MSSPYVRDTLSNLQIMPLRKSVSWPSWGGHWETDFFKKCFLSLKNTCFYKLCYVIHFEFPLRVFKSAPLPWKSDLFAPWTGGALGADPKRIFKILDFSVMHQWSIMPNFKIGSFTTQNHFWGFFSFLTTNRTLTQGKLMFCQNYIDL